MKTAKQRAAEAIAANPHKSNRAIADELGVDEKTVRNARATADNSAVQQRIGKDGKTRRLPTTRKQADPFEAVRRFAAECEARRKR